MVNKNMDMKWYSMFILWEFSCRKQPIILCQVFLRSPSNISQNSYSPIKKYPSMKIATEEVLCGMMPTFPSALLEWGYKRYKDFTRGEWIFSCHCNIQTDQRVLPTLLGVHLDVVEVLLREGGGVVTLQLGVRAVQLGVVALQFRVGVLQFRVGILQFTVGTLQFAVCALELAVGILQLAPVLSPAALARYVRTVWKHIFRLSLNFNYHYLVFTNNVSIFIKSILNLPLYNILFILTE